MPFAVPPGPPERSIAKLHDYNMNVQLNFYINYNWGVWVSL